MKAKKAGAWCQCMMSDLIDTPAQKEGEAGGEHGFLLEQLHLVYLSNRGPPLPPSRALWKCPQIHTQKHLLQNYKSQPASSQDKAVKTLKKCIDRIVHPSKSAPIY